MRLHANSFLDIHIRGNIFPDDTGQDNLESSVLCNYNHHYYHHSSSVQGPETLFPLEVIFAGG